MKGRRLTWVERREWNDRYGGSLPEMEIDQQETTRVVMEERSMDTKKWIGNVPKDLTKGSAACR